jgi:hypothetical protein
MHCRLEGLLDTLAPPLLRLLESGAMRRRIRPIEVLERAGTSEARQLLQVWAEQLPDQRRVLEARAALECIGPGNRSATSRAK